MARRCPHRRAASAADHRSSASRPTKSMGIASQPDTHSWLGCLLLLQAAIRREWLPRHVEILMRNGTSLPLPSPLGVTMTTNGIHFDVLSPVDRERGRMSTHSPTDGGLPVRAYTRRRIGHAGGGSRGRAMTEAEWLSACRDPATCFVDFVADSNTARKLRL